EDNAASTIDKTWVAQAEKQFAARFNTRPRRRGSVRPSTGGTPNEAWDTVEGTANNFGLGGFGRTLTVAGSQKLIITEKMVGFDLYYTKQKAGGSSLQIYIDTVLTATID